MVHMRSLGFIVAIALGASACVATTATSSESHAMRDGYTWLGERQVNGGADHDAIGVGRAEGKFNSIMIAVENAPIEMFDVTVTFGDGEKWEPRTRMTFNANTTSRMIDLPGHNRVIKRVDFRYGNLVAGARAKVELWAR